MKETFCFLVIEEDFNYDNFLILDLMQVAVKKKPCIKCRVSIILVCFGIIV